MNIIEILNTVKLSVKYTLGFKKITYCFLPILMYSIFPVDSIISGCLFILLNIFTYLLINNLMDKTFLDSLVTRLKIYDTKNFDYIELFYTLLKIEYLTDNKDVKDKYNKYLKENLYNKLDKINTEDPNMVMLDYILHNNVLSNKELLDKVLPINFIKDYSKNNILCFSDYLLLLSNKFNETLLKQREDELKLHYKSLIERKINSLKDVYILDYIIDNFFKSSSKEIEKNILVEILNEKKVIYSNEKITKDYVNDKEYLNDLINYLNIYDINLTINESTYNLIFNKITEENIGINIDNGINRKENVIDENKEIFLKNIDYSGYKLLYDNVTAYISDINKLNMINKNNELNKLLLDIYKNKNYSLFEKDTKIFIDSLKKILVEYENEHNNEIKKQIKILNKINKVNG